MASKDEEIQSAKKDWSDQAWQSYRLLPWASRRMVDVFLMFPRLGKWLDQREIARADGVLKRLSALLGREEVARVRRWQKA